MIVSCQRASRQRVLIVAGTALATLSIAACGSSSGSSSGAGHGVDLTAARAAIAPYVGHPGAFPVTARLGRRLPPGTRFVYLQCSTAQCGLFGKLLAPAIKAIGARLTVVNAGGTASTQQTAATSALSMKPAAVLLAGITPSELAGSVRQLDAAGIKVTSVGVMKPKQYGIAYSGSGQATEQLAGRLMADWAIVHKGSGANVVFYTTPELDFSSYMEQAFAHELGARCPACRLRTVALSVTTFGTTAPQTVVNDVQGHPATNVAVFASEEAAIGLPAALKAAGERLTTIGFAPAPGNLQDIKTGGLTAGVGLDAPVQEWTQVDATSRLLLGKPLPATESLTPIAILERKDITFDPTRGWTGYPDFARRFVKLWSAASPR